MESLLDREVSKREGPELIEFLLDIMPTYNRITMETNEEMRAHLEDEFCETLLNTKSTKSEHRPDYPTPYRCPECRGRDVCVDTDLACLVCRECGLQGPIGFEHGYLNLSGKDAHEVFRYKPVVYMLRLLDQVQGIRAPRVSKLTLQAIQRHLQARSICETDVSPTHVLQTLKALRLSSLYTHRWYLTRKLNPQYVPLRVPHELEERVRAVFLAAYEQFLRQYVWVSTRRRNFPSYMTFIQIVLQYLAVPDVDRHFTPPTNARSRHAVCKKVCDLIKAI